MTFWIWFVCGIALLMIEIIAPHLVTLWFAIAALFTGVFAYWVPGFSAQLAFFAVSSLITFSIGWFWLRKSLRMNLRPLQENKSIVGEAGTVISGNGGQPCCGRVRFQGPLIGDEVWEFHSDEQLNAGDRCIVMEVTGSTVKVKKA